MAQPEPPARLDHALGHAPRGSALRDFDGDGVLDLAVVLEESSLLAVFKGHGNGTFGANPPGDLSPIFFTTVPAGPMDVQVGQFNGATTPLDLVVVSCFASKVSLYAGNGDGTFILVDQVGTRDSCPKQAAVEDFDGDGHLDVAVAVNGSPPGNPNAIQGFVEIFPGDGTGTFGRSRQVSAGQIPEALVAADFNGDGLQDLAVANRGANTVTILLKDGAGTLNFARVVPDFSTGNAPVDIAAGDLNHDARPDVATANALSDSVSVLLNNLGGLSQFDGPFSIAVGRQPVAIGIANFNQDTLPNLAPLNDIVTANFQSDSITFLLNQDSTVVPNFMRVDFKVGRGPTSLTLSSGPATLDGDGKPDLVVANLLSDNFSVLDQSRPGEVSGLLFADDTITFNWNAAARVPDGSGSGGYHILRGLLSSLVDTNFDGVSETYGACLTSTIPAGTLATADPDVPAIGEGFFYIVIGFNSFGEGTAGFASSTGQRLGLNSSPCVP